MDRQRWIKVGLEIAEHLKELERIAEENGIDNFSIAIFTGKRSWATRIDEEKDIVWGVHVLRDGEVQIEEDSHPYYIQS